jgi:transketolase C-terminal domain/subunit
MGMKDTFGKSGKAEELLEYFGLTKDTIIKEIMKK